MRRVVERCAGLDVHRDTVVACVRVPGPDGEREAHTETFGTTTSELLRLGNWLEGWRVTRAAMEATGVYWKPVFYALEARLEVWLCNAQHLRNVPGRKTDVADAGWIAELVEHGLLRPSFVPPPPIRALRDLTRYRKTQIRERSQELQRLEKVLQDAGIKLTSVASQVESKSSRAMLEALLAGTSDPAKLAELAKGRLRAKIPALEQALAGHFDGHHAMLVTQILAHLDFLERSIATLSGQIEEMIDPFGWALELLMTVPGVARRTAEVVIAEIGADMTVFPTAEHLASWSKICPGNNESAGKRRNGRNTPGPTWLQQALTEAALSAARSKGTYLAAQHANIRARRGVNKATVAVAHSILVIAWHLLATRQPYSDLGADYLLTRTAEQRTRRLIRQLEQLGHKVTIQPAAA
jgi:transposase